MDYLPVDYLPVGYLPVGYLPVDCLPVDYLPVDVHTCEHACYATKLSRNAAIVLATVYDDDDVGGQCDDGSEPSDDVFVCFRIGFALSGHLSDAAELRTEQSGSVNQQSFVVLHFVPLG